MFFIQVFLKSHQLIFNNKVVGTCSLRHNWWIFLWQENLRFVLATSERVRVIILRQIRLVWLLYPKSSKAECEAQMTNYSFIFYIACVLMSSLETTALLVIIIVFNFKHQKSELLNICSKFSSWFLPVAKAVQKNAENWFFKNKLLQISWFLLYK